MDRFLKKRCHSSSSSQKMVMDLADHRMHHKAS